MKRQALKNAKELEQLYIISPTLDLKNLQSVAESAGSSAGQSLAKGIEKSLNSFKFSSAPYKKIGDYYANVCKNNNTRVSINSTSPKRSDQPQVIEAERIAFQVSINSTSPKRSDAKVFGEDLVEIKLSFH